MTIVADADNRNNKWANDKSAFGRRMLSKMGWSEGDGLGKNRQGTATNLRAIRREENLGIGAKTDTYGENGWTETRDNFHTVLANLRAQNDASEQPKKKKKKKKERTKVSSDKDMKVTGKESTSVLTLAQNRIAAGHAKKWREAKDLRKKSSEDMAAIFGMKVSQYQASFARAKLQSIGDSQSHASRDDNPQKHPSLMEEVTNKPEEISSSVVEDSRISNDKKTKKDRKKRKRKGERSTEKKQKKSRI
mmetsp:Transcript_5017/g.7245  ORF Transcript_5017/g.7245 Transcript_5017/m.7245 type:complete len:248 (+) Transcript_5017:99-842(+)|eukprot:CAMPEP_0184867100 /NCGR_PEP_ID=MMETSP0580-20130426/25044_1 /TAXON_ID=1118495 /ORGANISM="Dactyliosolen fragilissimus" /LENGTH=247 /DNA_ID=CAMNT_0027367149 /DNA_START=25 /DNA_END=768 /DNA_ORIENTATION=-